MNLARSCGEADVSSLLKSTSGQDLTAHTDVTGEVLGVPELPCGPCPPASTVTCQKAALVSFQSWTYQSPEIVGILLGCSQGNKRTICHSLVVGKAYEDVFGNETLATVCKNEELVQCGVVFCAGDNLDENRELTSRYLSDLRSQGFHDPLCVLVPRSGKCILFAMYICCFYL